MAYLAKSQKDGRGLSEPGIVKSLVHSLNLDKELKKIIEKKPWFQNITKKLLNCNETYTWHAKSNLKLRWHGSVEYFHQDYIYWRKYGLDSSNVLSCMIFVDDHNHGNGGLWIFPKSHKKIPPSLKNIYKEIKNSYPEFVFTNGNLKHWVKNEKIFLLNSSLTVIEGMSNSHQKLWSHFTNLVIKYISKVNNNTIFLLMGGNAISKSKLIDNNKHSILTCVHPSPLSAHRGFLGSKIFEKVNEVLINQDKNIINW